MRWLDSQTGRTRLGRGEARTRARSRLVPFVLLLLGMAMAVTLPGLRSSVSAVEVDLTDYRLDAGDRIRLRIFEWRPSLDQVHEWKALNDEYTVSAAGTVSLPLVGNIRARSLTTADFGVQVADAMRKRIGLSDTPHISVEVVQYRPFYVVGRVQKPGEYPYRPGLTVLQAVGIAGGMRRDEGGQRISREIIASRGELRGLRQRHRALLAKRARLAAESADSETIDFGLLARSSDPVLIQLMHQEREILAAQRQEHRSKISNLSDRRSHLSEQLRSLMAQRQNQLDEARLAQEDLANVQALVQKKLASEPRRLTAQRNVYQLEGDRLRLDASMMRVQEEIDKAVASIDELEVGRKAKLSVEIAAVQADLAEVLGKIATTEQLLRDASEADGAGDQDSASTTYTIVRLSGRREERRVVSETSLMHPGDTLKVEIDPSAAQMVRGDEQPSSETGNAASQAEPDGSRRLSRR